MSYDNLSSVSQNAITKTLLIVPTKNERDPPLFTGKLLIKFRNILRNTTQVIIRHRVKILFSVISSPITLERKKWGYILVSCAHSNTSYDDIFFDLLYFSQFFFLQIYVLYLWFKTILKVCFITWVKGQIWTFSNLTFMLHNELIWSN
jgi:hypothetical protein